MGNRDMSHIMCVGVDPQLDLLQYILGLLGRNTHMSTLILLVPFNKV